MTRLRTVLGVCAALLGSAGLAHADDAPRAPALDEFAYSLELTPREPRAVHAVLVPLAVYRGVADRDLADLRVFDATGRQVPHALRTLDARREVELGARELPLFPIRAKSAARDDLALEVQRDASGTVIAVRAGAVARGGRAGADAGAGEAIAAYVLDASALEHPITALHLTLEPSRADYVANVVVEASDDLGTFRTVATDQALVSLRYAGQRVERSELALPSVRARYLRLSAANGELPAAVVAARAELGTTHAPAERHRTRIRGRARAGEPGVYDFDLGGFLPVDAVRVVLPEDNSLIQAELSSFAQPGGAREPIHAGVFYRVVHEGARVESPALAVARRKHRHFELRVDAKGGGLGGALPELEIAYRPDQLLFVERGAAPFQLAYGHHAAADSSFDARELLALLPDDARARLPPSDTTAGAQRTRKGPAALRAPRPTPPIRTYVLWGVLVAAALVLGAAALRLGRNLR